MSRKAQQPTRTREAEGFEERAPRSETADASRQEVLSDEELQELLQSEFVQETLPQIKAPLGWHYCWLTMNSSYDPIHKRIRLGYSPVTFEEIVETGHTGYDAFKVQSGDYAGCVQCNEMVLFKLPMRRYQMIMSEFHHNMPLREEEGIRSAAAAPKKDSAGKPLLKFDEEDEGMQTLGKAPASNPSFA